MIVASFRGYCFIDLYFKISTAEMRCNKLPVFAKSALFGVFIQLCVQCSLKLKMKVQRSNNDVLRREQLYYAITCMYNAQIHELHRMFSLRMFDVCFLYKIKCYVNSILIKVPINIYVANFI